MNFVQGRGHDNLFGHFKVAIDVGGNGFRQLRRSVGGVAHIIIVMVMTDELAKVRIDGEALVSRRVFQFDLEAGFVLQDAGLAAKVFLDIECNFWVLVVVGNERGDCLCDQTFRRRAEPK